MSRPPRPSVFLDRAAYRRRRMGEAARLVPIFGLLLLSLPMIWAAGDGPAMPTTHVMGFVFLVWLLLSGVSAVLARYLRPDATGGDTPTDDTPMDGTDPTGEP